MIRSMTGFGQASKTDGELTVSVELKSVNHRFKEVHARLPRPLLYFEDTLKKSFFVTCSAVELSCLSRLKAVN